MKKFVNDPAQFVPEFMKGIALANPDLLEFTPEFQMIVRKSGPSNSKVSIVQGSGSGHEPAHVMAVGPGMLTGACQGAVFAAPPVDACYETIKACNSDAGVLVLVNNYQGDRMAWDMATEMAQAEGINVRQFWINDDVAVEDSLYTVGRRGVAGNFFVFKVAGAACDRGMTLDECEAVTRKANDRTYTVGVALESCSMPQTRRHNFEIGPEDMELGMGIHGEPGVSRERIRTADEIVDTIMDTIFREMKAEAGDRVAVLVNSFGATPQMELYILFRRVEQRLTAKNIVIEANWVGHYCTSLDMVGASISILHLDRQLTELLHHPCQSALLTINAQTTDGSAHG